MPLAAAGFAALAGAPEVRAADGTWGGDVAVQASFHFGNDDPARFGVALEGRVLAMKANHAGWTPRTGLGARLGLVGLQQMQLIIGPHLGVIREDRAVGGEVGVGYRLMRDPGLFVQGGAIGEVSYAQVRLAYATHRSVSLGVGLLMQPGGEPGPVQFGTGPEVVPGRPVRREQGRVPLPAAFTASRAIDGCAHVADGCHARRRAHAVWVDRARGEWASVPAFLELAEQLAVSQAPAGLQVRARLAAHEELAHTLIAGRIATRLGGTPLVLAPPVRDRRVPAHGRAGLLRLVSESWLDGCLNEAHAAASAAAEAEGASDPEISAGLRQIARDEASHAALAWDVLAWALGAGVPALKKDLATLAQAPRAKHHDTWAGAPAFGCLSAARTARIEADVAADARSRLLVRLAH